MSTLLQSSFRWSGFPSGKWHYRIPMWWGQIVIKPTADEVFSERYGFTPTRRLCGRSFTWRRYR
jgi:hypothetical protein